jgi:hypothetical protein
VIYFTVLALAGQKLGRTHCDGRPRLLRQNGLRRKTGFSGNVPNPRESVNDVTVIWERSGQAYYATITGPVGEVRFHLVVEPNSERWDWVAWRPGETRRLARIGHAGTVQGAMSEAESAAIYDQS